MLGLKLPTDPRWANIAEKNIDVEIAQLKKEVEVGGPSFLSISVVLGSVMGFKVTDYEMNWSMGYYRLPWLAFWVDVINKKSIEIAPLYTVHS